MVLALSQAVGPRRRASAPRRRKKILAAMLWCLLNGYDDDDDAYLFQNAYQSYQDKVSNGEQMAKKPPVDISTNSEARHSRLIWRNL